MVQLVSLLKMLLAELNWATLLVFVIFLTNMTPIASGKLDLYVLLALLRRPTYL